MKITRKAKLHNLDAYAFFAGAHDVPLKDTLTEIEAAHSMERAKIEQESVKRQKPFEARIDQLERQRHDVDAAWESIVRRLGLHEPPIASAITIAVLGLAALAVDAVLLGPGLDALGIADPVLQFLAAFGLAALSATTFHLAYETFGQQHHAREVLIVRRVMAGIATLSLLAWGILRGYQVQFAAALTGNPLGGFLAGHVMLASIFFAFVTLAAPVIGATAYHEATPKLHGWLTWTRSRAAHEAVHEGLGVAQKRLEEERLVLERAIARLNAQETNWQAIASQYHRRGHDHGARQTPGWVPIIKATGWSVGGLVLGSALGTMLAPLYFALPFGTWLVAFLHYRRARMHPTYDEFKQLENTHFAVRSDEGGRDITRSLPPPQEDFQ